MLAAIDNLGRINEAYGFDIADEVIAAVATRIRSQLRGKDHLGRFSGNKFGVILNNCTPDDMLVAADRLLAGARDDVVQTSAGPVAVTVTIGGVTAPRHARNVDEVLARAQDALDSAKAKRRGSFQAYRPNPEREAQRQENVRATDEIIKALNDRRIFLVYEPVVAIGSRAAGLLRMPDARAPRRRQPAGGQRGGAARRAARPRAPARSPRARARARRAGRRARPQGEPQRLGRLDRRSGLVGVARRRAARASRHRPSGSPSRSPRPTAIQDIDDTRGFVARVKDLGCRIAIDDFGAGYTSFRNLRKLGVDIVKIDGAFVQNLKRSEDDRAFVQTLIDLARRLGLETVAEWVQDEEAAAILADWGCDYLQGALVGLASPERPWAAHPPPGAIGLTRRASAVSGLSRCPCC